MQSTKIWQGQLAWNWRVYSWMSSMTAQFSKQTKGLISQLQQNYITCVAIHTHPTMFDWHTLEALQFQSDGARSLPPRQGWPFLLQRPQNREMITEVVLFWSWKCKTWWKGSRGSSSCNDLSRHSLRLRNWCLPGDDRGYDSVGTWQGWHFKVRSHGGWSSGSPVTVEEVLEEQRCDTLFGLISWSRQHPVVQVLLSVRKQITNQMY